MLPFATSPTRRRRTRHVSRRAAGALVAAGLSVGALAVLSPTPAGASPAWTGFVTNANDGTLSVLSTTGPSQIGSPAPTGNGPGADPAAVAVDGNQVFVANYGDNNVGVFNAATGNLADTIPVGTNPIGVAISPDGTEAFVANAYDSTVSVIDTTTDVVTSTVSVPGGLTAITAGTADSTPTVYVTTATTVVPITISGLVVGTPATLPSTTVGSTSVNPQARALALTPDGTTLYVADFASGEVDEYATSSLATAPTQIPVGTDAGSEPLAIATAAVGGSQGAYVANYGEGSVSVLEEGQAAPVATIDLANGVNSGPDGIAVTPDSSTVAVTEQNTGQVETITTNSTPSDDALSGSTQVGSGNASGPSAVAFPPLSSVSPTLTVTTSSLPAATVGVAYSAPLSATGGVGPITWSVATGASQLSAVGLSLSSNGVISGTPTTGSASFTVTAMDADSDQETSGTLSVTASAITITTPTTLASGAQGSAYPGVSFGAQGGVAPYTWSGTAPFGLTLSSTGVLSGTPTSTGTSTTFDVTVTDSTPVTPLTTNEDFTLTVGPTITLTPASLPTVVVGQTYTTGVPVAAVAASGGTPPYSYALSAGSLPPGLAINPTTGAITGTDDGAGTFPVTVQATDAGANTATQTYSVTSYGVTTQSIPTAVINQAYTTGSPLVTLAAVGGTTPYTWSVSPSTLPAGLSLNTSTGAITGTPTDAATTGTFTFTVTDSSGTPVVASTSLTITIGTTPITTSAVTIDEQAHYTTSNAALELTASGGDGDYSWSIVSGTLPAGLALDDTTGAVTGTPTSLGDSTVVFQAEDTSEPTPNVSDEQVAFTVQSPPTVTTTSLPAGQVGSAYSTTLSAGGGTAPYTWSVASGSLPAGLSLSPSGVLSGTPTSSGEPSAVFEVTDALSGTGESAPLATEIAAAPAPPAPPAPPAVTHGYWLVGSDGGIFSFGSAAFHGSMGGIPLQRPVVGIVPTADRGGYWLVASDGGVFSFGDTTFYGSIPGQHLSPAGSGLANSLNAPIVGMVPSHDQGGYFMVASDGGVFAFGDAHFAGSCPGIGGCSGAAVAVMPDASGNGYWLVTKTGNVYTFGGAPYYGAPGAQSSPITSAVATPDGGGYYILDADGQVFAYGDAQGLGSVTPGAVGGFNPASAIFVTSDNAGYWVSDALGDVYTFGDAPDDGSMAGTKLNGPIIAAAGN